METLSALLAICAGNSPVPGEFPAQRPVTRSFDVSLICVWINGWVNNRDAGEFRCYRAHYDVSVMQSERMGYRCEHVPLWTPCDIHWPHEITVASWLITFSHRSLVIYKTLRTIWCFWILILVDINQLVKSGHCCNETLSLRNTCISLFATSSSLMKF